MIIMTPQRGYSLFEKLRYSSGLRSSGSSKGRQNTASEQISSPAVGKCVAHMEIPPISVLHLGHGHEDESARGCVEQRSTYHRQHIACVDLIFTSSTSRGRLGSTSSRMHILSHPHQLKSINAFLPINK